MPSKAWLFLYLLIFFSKKFSVFFENKKINFLNKKVFSPQILCSEHYVAVASPRFETGQRSNAGR